MCLCFWGVYSYKKGLSVISLSAETCTGQQVEEKQVQFASLLSSSGLPLH